MNTTAIVLLGICTFFCFQNVESRVSQCYRCDVLCYEPLLIETCRSSELLDYSCISAWDESVNTQAKGCIYKDDEEIRSECDEIQQGYGGHCYICETNLCNSAKMNPEVTTPADNNAAEVHFVSVLLLTSVILCIK